MAGGTLNVLIWFAKELRKSKDDMTDNHNNEWAGTSPESLARRSAAGAQPLQQCCLPPAASLPSPPPYSAEQQKRAQHGSDSALWYESKWRTTFEYFLLVVSRSICTPTRSSQNTITYRDTSST